MFCPLFCPMLEEAVEKCPHCKIAWKRSENCILATNCGISHILHERWQRCAQQCTSHHEENGNYKYNLISTKYKYKKYKIQIQNYKYKNSKYNITKMQVQKYIYKPCGKQCSPEWKSLWIISTQSKSGSADGSAVLCLKYIFTKYVLEANTLGKNLTHYPGTRSLI